MSALPTSDPDVILVGVGRWGRNIHRSLRSLCIDHVVVDSQASSDEIPIDFNNLSAALTAYPVAPSVIIATPPITHYELCREALLAGRHVFVEKPMCLSLSDANALVDLLKVQENGPKSKRTVFQVDHLLQHSCEHRALLYHCRSGLVGHIQHVKMTRLNFGTVRSEENVLWSLLTHDIAILLSIMGSKILDVSAFGNSIVNRDIEDFTNVHINFENGSKATIEGNWLHPKKERRTVVYGENGCLVLNENFCTEKGEVCGDLEYWKYNISKNENGRSVKIVKELCKLPDADESVNILKGKFPLESAIRNFMDTVKGRSTSVVSAADGLAVIQVLHAATQSLRNGGGAFSIRDCAGVENGTLHRKLDDVFIHESAIIDKNVRLGSGTKIWHFSHVMGGATLGNNVKLGQNVFVGPNVCIGNGVKVQNNVNIYSGVKIEDSVFLGPSCTFTNVKNPRAFIERKDEFMGTLVQQGVTVGANVTVVCGVTLGKYCFIGAGSTVTKDVKAYQLVYGNPACAKGWMGKGGYALKKVENGSQWMCEKTGEFYEEDGERGLKEL